MEQNHLKEELITSLLNMYKMEVIANLSQFVGGELALMMYVAHTENSVITPSDISDTMKITRGRVTAILNSLRMRKFIKLKTSLKDRRKVHVSLTEDGAKYLAEKEKIANQYFVILVEKLGVENIQSLIHIINLSVDAMQDVKL